MGLFQKIKRLLLIAVIMPCALLSCASPPPDFELTAEADKHVLGFGELRLIVETKNVGGDYKYTGSSYKVGAVPELYTFAGGKKYSLASAPVPETPDNREVTVKSGEIIRREWYFYNDGAYGEICPAGVYSLKLKYFEYEKIYPAYLIVTDEGAQSYNFGQAEPDAVGEYDGGVIAF